MSGNGFARPGGRRAPDELEQLVAAEDLPRMLDEDAQQVELACRQFDRQSVSPFADLTRSLHRPRRPSPPRRRRRLRALLLAPPLAGLVGLCLLMSACGGSSSPGVAAVGTTTSATTTATSDSTPSAGSALAFARCMRSHGVPNFPDPDPQGNFPRFSTGVSKQTSTAASDACKHLLPSGGGGGVAETRGDQQKLAFALKVAQCMRGHGFPTYPDPTGPTASSQGSGTRFSGTGIDTKSPQFQTTETACEKQSRQALGLP